VVANAADKAADCLMNVRRFCLMVLSPVVKAIDGRR
jgi:hypothetical protein